MSVPYGFLEKLRIRNPLGREFLAELLGTFVLVVIGDGAFAWAILNRVHDVLAIVFGWIVAVMLGISVAGGVTGGHVNPAVTLALATLGKLPWRKVPVYIAAQHLGGFLASIVLYATYHDMITVFDGGNRTVGGHYGTAHIWATYPRMDSGYSDTEPVVSLGTTFLDQIVGTGLLMFTAMAIIDPRNLDYPKWMHPVALGLMIAALALTFGSNCMAPLNPARDFATRVFTAIAGYGSATFSPMNYHYWWVGGLVGPHLGAIIGGWLYYLGVELHWPEQQKLQDVEHEHELKELMNDNTETTATGDYLKKPRV